MRTRGEVVYLVDDDPAVREALSELFGSLEIEHVTFGSAREFLAFVRSDDCACMVLDVQLPDISGLDLQQQLGDKSSLPIVFITGHGDIPSTVRAMKAGAIEFLTKPLDPTVLIAAIRAGFAADLERRRETAAVVNRQQRFALLTPREREVLPLIAAGMLNKQAAAVLGISEVTLQLHRSQIMRKLEVASFAELVRMAVKLGIEVPGQQQQIDRSELVSRHPVTGLGAGGAVSRPGGSAPRSSTDPKQKRHRSSASSTSWA